MNATFAAAALLLAAACSDATGPTHGLRVETTASVYTISPPGTPGPLGATVGFTVRNTGSTPLEILRCGDSVVTGVQAQDGGEWKGYVVPLCIVGPGVVPVVLAPGESAAGQTQVYAAGRFRLQVPVGTPTDAELSARAASPAFTVRQAEN